MSPPADAPTCVFCAILRGATPGAFVLGGPGEDGPVAAFLDVRPLFKGHTLVVPRAHIVTLRDLPDPLVAPFFSEVRRVAAAVEDGCEAHGSFVAENNVVSQSVAHLHVHVVPRRRKDGLRGFFWPREKYGDAEEAAKYAAQIRASLVDP